MADEPFLEYSVLPQSYPNRFEEALESIVVRLFAGENPATIRRELINLEDNPGLLCLPTWSCDLYLYVLGLVNELLEARTNAIEALLSLWWDYSKSPFTTMARLKLEGVGIPATPTITPTRTATASPNPTATPSGTPATATLTPSITLTLYPTPTFEDGSPYPGPSTATPTDITNPYPGYTPIPTYTGIP